MLQSSLYGLLVRSNLTNVSHHLKARFIYLGQWFTANVVRSDELSVTEEYC